MTLRYQNSKMNTRITIAAILVFILFPLRIFAQSNELSPGIYTIVDGKSIPLTYTYGGSNTRYDLYFEGNELSPVYFRYRGETSNVEASDTLIYVIDPASHHTYNPFNKWMNPNGMIVIPLNVNIKKAYREYNLGIGSDNINDDEMPREDFEWEKLDKTTFQITLANLNPGEYGIVFRKGKFGPFDYTRIHCFTISRHQQE